MADQTAGSGKPTSPVIPHFVSNAADWTITTVRSLFAGSAGREKLWDGHQERYTARFADDHERRSRTLKP